MPVKITEDVHDTHAHLIVTYIPNTRLSRWNKCMNRLQWFFKKG